MGVVHRPSPDWASHIPVLIKTLELSDGPVLELGMGMMSTPLMHILCEASNRELTSYDSDERYVKEFSKFASGSHNIGLVTRWSAPDITSIIRSTEWSVVLVDQKPAEARIEAIQLLTKADYIIVHDTQLHAESPNYAYDQIFPLFKYLYDYKKFPTWTTVLSNKHDVNNIFIS